MRNETTESGRMTRREFVKSAALGTALIGLHPDLGAAPDDVGATQKPVGPDLIDNVRLSTAAPLDEMKAFYVDKMGFPVAAEADGEITFLAGRSTLTFVRVTSEEAGSPWYHFAFNIPENKILEALAWQRKRCPIIPTPPRAQDPEYPDEIRHFPRWNAHSVFFWDPAGNLLEHIARHDLANGRAGEFTSQDVLNISEIAFVVDDQQAMAKAMHAELGLPVYPAGTGFWWAMGDENGLMLAIPKRIWGENTDTPKRFTVYPTEVTIRGGQGATFTYADSPYSIRVKPEADRRVSPAGAG